MKGYEQVGEGYEGERVEKEEEVRVEVRGW